MADNISATEQTGRVTGVLVGLIGIGWGICWFAGCSDNQQPSSPGVPKIRSESAGSRVAVPPAPPAIPKSKFSGDADSPGSPAESGPLAEARERVKRFEQKRAQFEALLERALAERDELVAKLREAGVTKPSDLKGNPRGQKLAESLAKLVAEIEGIERQLATIDSAILDAQAVVRRLERERAGIGDEEMRKLAEQLREAEERTGGAAGPVTPLDLEAALDRALRAPSGQPRKAAPGQAVAKLVGKWGHHHPTDGSTYSLEFTKGNTVILMRYALEAFGTYALDGNTLTLTDRDGRAVVYSLEFSSAKEVLFRAAGRHYGRFDGLTGRWSKK